MHDALSTYYFGKCSGPLFRYWEEVARKERKGAVLENIKKRKSLNRAHLRSDLRGGFFFVVNSPATQSGKRDVQWHGLICNSPQTHEQCVSITYLFLNPA